MADTSFVEAPAGSYEYSTIPNRSNRA